MQSQTELRQSITNTIIEALSNGGFTTWRHADRFSPLKCSTSAWKCGRRTAD